MGIRAAKSNFNSIKVRLKPSFFLSIILAYIYFNSIKVRLNLLTVEQGETVLEFQFHKGTIKTIMYKLFCLCL